MAARATCVADPVRVCWDMNLRTLEKPGSSEKAGLLGSGHAVSRCLAGIGQFQRRAHKPVDHPPQPGEFGAGQQRAVANQGLGVPPGLGQNGRVPYQVGDAKRGQAVLLQAEQAARTAQPEVDFGQFETVVRLGRTPAAAGAPPPSSDRRTRTGSPDARRG